MKNVFLTGATGFVGIHLLQKLLATSGIGIIYILCRDKNPDEKINPVLAAAHKYDIDLHHDKQKIRIIKGDITLPLLGIPAENYDEICHETEVIYHVAARVNHILPWQALRAANVDSTATLLKIAMKHKTKVMNFVSTLGSATKINAEKKIAENFPADDILESDMGYLLSKWASEKLIAQFHAMGYAANIQRLGYITGHSQTGVSLCHNNQLMLLVKSSIQLGYAPRLSRLVNMTPVDMATAVMNVPEFHHAGGQVVNIINTAEYISWNDLIKWFSHKYAVKLIDFPAWQQKIKQINEDNALFRFLPLYAKASAEKKVLRFATNILQYETRESIRLIKKYGIKMPLIKNNLLGKYHDYLVRTGFLPACTEN